MASSHWVHSAGRHGWPLWCLGELAELPRGDTAERMSAWEPRLAARAHDRELSRSGVTDNFATTLQQLCDTVRQLCDNFAAILRHFATTYFVTTLQQFFDNCAPLYETLRPPMCSELLHRKPNLRKKCDNAISATTLRHFAPRTPSSKTLLQRSWESKLSSRPILLASTKTRGWP